MILNILLSCFYSFMGSLGFGVLFNIRGKNLFFASIGGGIGWLIYLILTNLSYSVTISLFIASLIISIYSEIFARIMKTPVTIYVICAMIPLVPGSGMYYTMAECVKGTIYNSLSYGFETLVNAGAIAVAIVLISSISKFITLYKSRNSTLRKNKKDI